MAIYINGTGVISAQQPWNKSDVIDEVSTYQGDRILCIEPDYTKYFDVRQLRRMSRIIKMGMVCGIEALKEANVQVPDGIITGTSYGCLEDTGIFLTKMIENKESALNPTPFIQSTHNTIGSQIALTLQCQGYNQTYTQRAFSFENALVDAMLELTERGSQNLLVGAADEITNYSHSILDRFDLFRTTESNLDLFKGSANGTINGEGAAYFVLSGDMAGDSVELVTTNMLYNATFPALQAGIIACLESVDMTTDDIDVVMLGKSGDASLDNVTNSISTRLFRTSTTTVFKHLTGEFPCASAIAMALAARVIQSQHIPPAIVETNRGRKPRTILIYNSYFGRYHSLILLKAC